MMVRYYPNLQRFSKIRTNTTPFCIADMVGANQLVIFYICVLIIKWNTDYVNFINCIVRVK